MVFDHIFNAYKYFCLNQYFEKAFCYLKDTDFLHLAEGKYSIENTECFAIVNQYKTKSIEESFVESHIKYIDIQHMVKGKEKFGFGNIQDFKILERNDDNDLIKLQGNLDFLTLNKDYFTILFPQDVHMPGIIADQSEDIIKVVVKVPI